MFLLNIYDEARLQKQFNEKFCLGDYSNLKNAFYIILRILYFSHDYVPPSLPAPLILGDFQICIRVPLIKSILKTMSSFPLFNHMKKTIQKDSKTKSKSLF